MEVNACHRFPFCLIHVRGLCGYTSYTSTCQPLCSTVAPLRWSKNVTSSDEYDIEWFIIGISMYFPKDRHDFPWFCHDFPWFSMIFHVPGTAWWTWRIVSGSKEWLTLLVEAMQPEKSVRCTCPSVRSRATCATTTDVSAASTEMWETHTLYRIYIYRYGRHILVVLCGFMNH